eukprot:10322557-Heterocapsa_arctica.AAC.1
MAVAACVCKPARTLALVVVGASAQVNDGAGPPGACSRRRRAAGPRLTLGCGLMCGRARHCCRHRNASVPGR